MEHEPTPVPTQEELAQRLKFAAQVIPPSETGWPTMADVVRDYPQLCSEEQCWVLEDMLNEAHKRRDDGNN